jgi:hypothetical protein
MISQFKYIEFQQGHPLHDHPAYLCKNRKTASVLAVVHWYPAWRQYIVQFVPDSVWSSCCLADVQEFLCELGRQA